MRNIAIEILKQFQKINKNVSSMRNMNHHFDNNNLSPYHLEGDVWTHTMLAFNSFLMTLRNEIFKNDRLVTGCAIAILCHDLGKSITREQKTKKLTFELKVEKNKEVKNPIPYNKEIPIPKYGFNSHDNAGTQLCIDFIYDLQENGFFIDKDYTLQNIMEDVLPVISNHMFYYNWDIEKLKSTCSSKYQYKIWAELAMADFNGSISEDGDIETYTKFHNMLKFADECFNETTKFENINKLDIKHHKQFHLNYNKIIKEPEFTYTDIIIVCGLPGTGKDYSFEDLGYEIVSYDIERMDAYLEFNNKNKSDNSHELYMKAFDWCNKYKIDLNSLILKRAKNFFAEGKKVAILNVNQSRKRRRKLMNMFKGKTISCFWIGAKCDTILARDEKRKDIGGKTIGSKIILSMAKRIQYPTIQEGFEFVNYIDNNENKRN